MPIGTTRAAVPGTTMRAEVVQMAGSDRDARTAEVHEDIDRLVDDWIRALPSRRPTLLGRESVPEDVIRVDEYRDGGTLRIRAELPGVDPDHDVEITVAQGVLRITAHRPEPQGVDEDDYVRREIRSGSLSRTVPLPDGVAPATAVVAHYDRGILSIAFPWTEPGPATRIVVTRD